jgi:hypothetical protein
MQSAEGDAEKALRGLAEVFMSRANKSGLTLDPLRAQQAGRTVNPTMLKGHLLASNAGRRSPFDSVVHGLHDQVSNLRRKAQNPWVRAGIAALALGGGALGGALAGSRDVGDLSDPMELDVAEDHLRALDSAASRSAARQRHPSIARALGLASAPANALKNRGDRDDWNSYLLNSVAPSVDSLHTQRVADRPLAGL